MLCFNRLYGVYKSILRQKGLAEYWSSYPCFPLFSCWGTVDRCCKFELSAHRGAKNRFPFLKGPGVFSKRFLFCTWVAKRHKRHRGSRGCPEKNPCYFLILKHFFPNYIPTLQIKKKNQPIVTPFWHLPTEDGVKPKCVRPRTNNENSQRPSLMIITFVYKIHETSRLSYF